MPWLNPMLAIYALLNIVLGVLGYVNAGSRESLIAGIAIGLLVLVSLALVPKYPRVGRIMAFVVALLVLGRFGPRFASTGEFYPAGILAIASAIVAGLLVAGHFLARRRSAA